MKSRCYNKNEPAYKWYGGRGIKVCDRWYNSFINFLIDMKLCPDGKSLDRIDYNGNYEPSNCWWGDNIIQGRNKRSTGLYKYKNILLTIPQIASFINTKSKTLRAKIVKHGWPIPELIGKI